VVEESERTGSTKIILDLTSSSDEQETVAEEVEAIRGGGRVKEGAFN
jgi:hypothetical protein